MNHHTRVSGVAKINYEPHTLAHCNDNDDLTSQKLLSQFALISAIYCLDKTNHSFVFAQLHKSVCYQIKAHFSAVAVVVVVLLFLRDRYR